MPKLKEALSPEFIRFKGATYKKAVQYVRGPGLIPSMPGYDRTRVPRVPPLAADPEKVKEKVALQRELSNDLDKMIQHLAESPLGPEEFREKFGKFSKGISVLTDQVEEPLEKALRGLVLTFKSFFHAKQKMNNLKF